MYMWQGEDFGKSRIVLALFSSRAKQDLGLQASPSGWVLVPISLTSTVQTPPPS